MADEAGADGRGAATDRAGASSHDERDAPEAAPAPLRNPRRCAARFTAERAAPAARAVTVPSEGTGPTARGAGFFSIAISPSIGLSSSYDV
ncbi:hypothetical protein [Collinsella sp. An7]|uniref:hypothetical protein n=1 Tax=Collinsella sp. An7 TaxID=1965651 RepID=UPI001EF6F57E|nr:hypothetical protein [Collinsella sp. An7]